MEAGRASYQMAASTHATLVQNIPTQILQINHAPKNSRTQPSNAQAPRQNTSPRKNLQAKNSQGQNAYVKSPRQNVQGQKSQFVQQEPQQSPRQQGANTGQPDSTTKNAQNKNDPYKVHVSGFPPYTTAAELIRTFARCGIARIDNLSSRNCAAVLVFSTEAEALTAIQAHKKVNIYGEFLHVRKYESKERPVQNRQVFPKSKEKENILPPSKISLDGDFSCTLERVLSAVRLTQEEAARLGHLYQDVETVLQEHWPGCVAMPFGSITTGLGIKSSDADCYVQLPTRFQRPGDMLVNRAKRLLQAHPQVFSEILAIPRANTPIVKFYHLPTNTNCDLSFKTPLGTQNSKLISFLLHADPRLIPMAVAVKYWAKVHGLSGTGKLTNYALTMMIIFYLQQGPKPILPSVEWLQRDPVNDVIVDYWNTGFMPLRELLPPNESSASIAELVGGFFDYYSAFNFDDMVVCPYMGEPVPKNIFKDLNLLPLQFERYKLNVTNNLVMPLKFLSPICVQDPFEQSHNVASAVTVRLATELRAFFKFAATAYEKEKATECRNFLKTILLEKPKIVKSKTHPEYRINLFARTIVNIVNPEWRAVVREAVLEVFEKMLSIKMTKMEEKVNPESKKEKERYTGMVTKALWRRKQFAKMYNMMNLDLVTKQAKITADVMNFEPVTFECQFQSTLTFTETPRGAALAIRLANGNTEAFNEFGRFFISVIQNWLMQLLKPHAAPAPETRTAIAETIELLDRNLEPSEDLDSDDEDSSEPDPPADGPTSADPVAPEE